MLCCHLTGAGSTKLWRVLTGNRSAVIQQQPSLDDHYFCRVSHGRVEQIPGMRPAQCSAFGPRGRSQGCGLPGVTEVTRLGSKLSKTNLTGKSISYWSKWNKNCEVSVGPGQGCPALFLYLCEILILCNIFIKVIKLNLNKQLLWRGYFTRIGGF